MKSVRRLYLTARREVRIECPPKNRAATDTFYSHIVRCLFHFLSDLNNHSLWMRFFCFGAIGKWLNSAELAARVDQSSELSVEEVCQAKIYNFFFLRKTCQEFISRCLHLFRSSGMLALPDPDGARSDVQFLKSSLSAWQMSVGVSSR